MSLILNGTDGISDVDGTAATPAIRGTDANTGIFFPAADTIAFAEGGAESMRLDSAGNLGIGTTSPVNKLQIGAASDTAIALSNSSSVTSGNRGTISMFNSGTSTCGYIRFGADTDNVGTDMQFAVRPVGGSIKEAMRIVSGGQLCIGKTTTAFGTVGSYFNASGQGLFTFNATDSGGAGVYINRTGVDGTVMLFYKDTNNIGSISVTGSATAYNTSSDYRLKENIAPLTGALSKVAQLKPVTYKWKSTGKNGEGFIAHELAEVAPDAVTGEKDAVETVDDLDENGKVIGTKEVPKYQGIDVSFLVATLTAAIQELKAELDGVKAELATLKA
jgi:hypothetical protein